MPIYEYHCPQCDFQFELLVRGDQSPECPECQNKAVQKQWSVPAAHSASNASLPISGCGAPACQSGGCQFEQ